MIAPPARRGEALALSRRLDRAPDPLALYRALSDNGARKDTLLFETADAESGAPARSFVVAAAALRAIYRGGRVQVEALSAGGVNALEAIAAGFEGSAALVDRTERGLTFAFPRADEGAEDEERLKAPSPLDALRAMTTRFQVAAEGGPHALFCAGVFAYDLLDSFERLPAAAADPLGYPDYAFWLAEALVILDRKSGHAQVVCPAFGSDDPRRAAAAYHDASARLALLVERCQQAAVPGQVGVATPGSAGRDGPSSAPALPESDLDDAAYAAAVARVKERITAGDVFQIVPSRTFRAPCPDPLAAYAELRRINPSPYMFYVNAEDHALFGASPETSVQVVRRAGEAGGTRRTLHLRPLAGTRPRGRAPGGGIDLDLDDRIEAELRLDEKEIAEHMMLVDLARNDVARVTRPGSRHLARLLSVVRYSHVMHLESEVVGDLRGELDALHAVQATMNMGTLVGAPKVRAAEILREVEPSKRGPYGGAVGYFTHAGELDTAIVIRSAVVKDGVAHVRAGAGVVHDSDPELEAAETRRKAQAVLSAIRAADARPVTTAPATAKATPAVAVGREVVFIDNFDSFTFNLVEAFERLGCRVRSFRNTVEASKILEMAEASGALIVISPGPGSPAEAGCCLELIARARGRIPVFGVCLGHQAIVQEAGGEVGAADTIVHGKGSVIAHDGEGPLRGLPSPLRVGRYHSLATRRLPGRFRVHARIGDMAMAISDPEAYQVGVQFHPESILTPEGAGLIGNVLAQAAEGRAR